MARTTVGKQGISPRSNPSDVSEWSISTFWTLLTQCRTYQVSRLVPAWVLAYFCCFFVVVCVRKKNVATSFRLMSTTRKLRMFMFWHCCCSCPIGYVTRLISSKSGTCSGTCVNVHSGRRRERQKVNYFFIALLVHSILMIAHAQV